MPTHADRLSPDVLPLGFDDLKRMAAYVLGRSSLQRRQTVIDGPTKKRSRAAVPSDSDAYDPMFMSSHATIRAMLADDEDAVTDVATDAAVRYCALSAHQRPVGNAETTKWFFYQMRWIARDKACHWARSLGMLLPHDSDGSDGSATISEYASPGPSPEERLIQRERLQTALFAWGCTELDDKLLEAHLKDSLDELSAETGTSRDALYHKVRTRQCRARRAVAEVDGSA